MEGTWGYYGKLSPMPNIYAEYVEIRDSLSPDYAKIKGIMANHYEALLKELTVRLKKTAADINAAVKLIDETR